MMVLYVLCFVYIFFKNTEYVCLVLLLCLNIFYILLFSGDIGNTTIDLFIFYTLNIPTRVMTLLLWVLIMISNSWLIMTLMTLRSKFLNSDSGINLGSKYNYIIKDKIIIFLICSSIAMLSLHLLSVAQIPFIPNNRLKLIVLIAGFLLTTVSLQLNNELSSNTKIITS